MQNIKDQVLRYRNIQDISDWRQTLGEVELRKTQFAEYTEQLPIHPDVIFYESMSGAKMMDSPFAIFKGLLSDPRFKADSKLHVWSVRSKDIVPEFARNMENVIFVKRHTKEYMYYLARAKHVISNSTLPEYFVRRKEQKYLNTWHGIGYKALGRTKDSQLGAGLAVFNMLQSTHSISPCEFMTSIHLNGFSMRGNYSGTLAETGYPRIDSTLNISHEEKESVRQELKIDNKLKTILYAPTWRGDSNSEAFDLDRLSEDLHQLSKMEANVIFMGHHIMQRQVRGMDFSNIILPADNSNTNQLLSVVDILITDYSSIFFDFLVTGLPIIHYMYDYEEYKAARGLSLETSQLPGPVARSSCDLIELVHKFLNGKNEITEKYENAREMFCKYDQGNSTLKVIDWFFFDIITKVNIIDTSFGKKNLIFWAGRMDDDEDRGEFLDRIRQTVIDSKHNVTLFCARNVIKYPEVRALLDDLNDQITVISRGGYAFGMTGAEICARSKKKSPLSPELDVLSMNIYQREYRRIFGSHRFDEVILYPKLTFFWKELAKFSVK